MLSAPESTSKRGARNAKASSRCHNNELVDIPSLFATVKHEIVDLTESDDDPDPASEPSQEESDGEDQPSNSQEGEPRLLKISREFETPPQKQNDKFCLIS